MNDKVKMLSLENISKEYTQGQICIEILKNLELEVEEGQIISIIGASGSGKSTLLQIIGLLDSKFTGDIYFENKQITKLSEEEKRLLRRDKIGYVYQYHHLMKDFTSRENIAMPSLIKGQNIEQALEKADELLDYMGMIERKFHFPAQLSGGEKQRVAIARALFSTPKILLADEPTGNLDNNTATKVLNLMIDLARYRNSSAIIVTHSQEVAKKSDIIFELKSGKLVEASIK